MVFINDKLDISIIEIKQNDNIDDFFELDNNMKRQRLFKLHN